MPLEAIGIGDLHLTDDKGRGGLSNYIEQPDEYVMSEVSRVVKWALKKGITTAFLYGDLGENPRLSYEAQLALKHGLERHPDMEFIAYLGNHDKLTKNSTDGHSLQIIKEMGIKNLRVIEDDEVIKIGKTQVKVCPWPSTAFDPKLLNFGHTEVKGSKSDSGRVMDGDELPKSKAVVCMGHLHTNHQVRETYYSGTLYQTNFGESLPKYFHHIKWSSLDDYEISSVPFDPKYKLFNCVIESEADIKALPRDPQHLIKLVIKDGADVDVPNWSNVVISKVFKTKSDLAAILTEDLLQGSELVIKTADFFKDWLAAQSIPQALKVRAAKLRKEILYGNRT